jgi:hypothetical protein
MGGFAGADIANEIVVSIDSGEPRVQLGYHEQIP